MKFKGARLSPKSIRVLAKVAAVLNKYPDVKILLSGHTSKGGPKAEEVSKARAEAVKEQLGTKVLMQAALKRSVGQTPKTPAAAPRTTASS